MTFQKLHLIAAAAMLAAGAAQAAVSADEAKQLGTTLTPWGAEVAGNKDGTIPAYTGGLAKPPAGWSKDKPGVRPDPFAADKVLFSITAKNVAEYADKLTPGYAALVKKYPTFRIDVYPTRRSNAFPKAFQDATIKNGTRCKAVDGGLSIQDCHGGLPFPIPKTGNEAMWNTVLRYAGHAVVMDTANWYVDGGGRATLAARINSIQEFPNYDPNATSAESSWKVTANYTAPARTAGEGIMVVDPMNYVADKRRAWQYIPGQRRVKLAPDLAYDTPAPNSAGIVTMDQAPTFAGSMDRFDFKLVGKKELYIPYNTYKMGAGGDDAVCGPAKLMTANHWNPDCVRWELHRVWVVEATLKPGKRHTFSKRVYFLDEDGANATLQDMYDAGGQIQRVGFTLNKPMYEVPAPLADVFGTIDLISGSWLIQNWDFPGSKGIAPLDKIAPNLFTPENLAGTGIR